MEVEDLSLGIIPVRKINDTYEILLCKSARYGYYLFPKGHPEPNEAKIVSAQRELLEETGHRATNFWYGESWGPDESQAKELPILSYYYQTRTKRVHKSVIFFLAEVVYQEAIQDVDEICSVEWVLADESVAPKLHHAENIEHYLRCVLPLLRKD